MQHRDKFSSGLNLSRRAYNLFLFAVLHNFHQYFDPFEIKIGAADISAPFKATKALKKW